VGLAAVVAAASLALAPGPGWAPVSTGPDGGLVWQGRIPNTFVRSDHRPSAVYLPPGYDTTRRYPVVYLLHGMRGSPSSYWDSLKLASVADVLIATGRTPPFIAVMPVAGPILHPGKGEWAGVWESYVVDDVVPWADAHLSTSPSPRGRALEGLSAGGFGAVDIGLRHPGIFGTLGSWAGYFTPVFHDGPFAHATPAVLAAHDPELLVRRDARRLRRDGVRFYISTGDDHGAIRSRWSVSFAHELHLLRLRHVLWVSPPDLRRIYWRATMPSALAYAVAPLG
jgi:enterochelin esterase-like enzyme